MAPPARSRISGVDTTWLRMEQPGSPMMIVGVMVLDGKASLANVRRMVRARFLSFERFRCRAVQDATGAWWEEDGGFDLDWHVRRAPLGALKGKAGLETLVSELASTPLDPKRPLWQFHLVENYAGGSAIVARIHHCYADGIALIQVVLSMTHATAEGSLAIEPEEPAPAPEEPSQDFWSQLLTPVTSAVGSVSDLGKGLLDQGRALAANPQGAVDAVQDAARRGADIAAEVARLILMGTDSPTRFKGAIGERKRVAWAEPLPLDVVKAMGKALGCSINDVLLAMAAGTLRDYLEEKGDAAAGVEVRAVVPVNLRPAALGRNLGNQFGLVFAALPVGIEHPLERLYEVRRRMRELKDSSQPVIAFALLSAVGYGPRVLQEQVTGLLAKNASLVMTNVPGPQHPLYFAGRRVTGLDFWVPQSGGIGLGLSILSYDGRIRFGVMADAGLVPDPHRIADRFGSEFEKLLWLTIMSPWGEGDAGEPPAASPVAAQGKRRRGGRRKSSARRAGVEASIPKRFRDL